MHLPKPLTGELKVEIFTTAFRCVRKSDQVENGQQDLCISLQDNWGYTLANGLYFVRVTAAGKVYLSKLLVLK